MTVKPRSLMNQWPSCYEIQIVGIVLAASTWPPLNGCADRQLFETDFEMQHIFPESEIRSLVDEYYNDPNCTLIVGSKLTCKTTLLFQAALSIASQLEGQVVFIRHQRLTSLPFQVHGMTQADPSIVQHIRFIYIYNVSDLIHYLSNIHTNSVLPAALLIDDIDFYAEQLAQEGNMEQAIAKICALAIDAVQFCSNKRNQQCALMMSANYNDCESAYQRIAKIMFLHYWLVRPQDDTSQNLHLPAHFTISPRILAGSKNISFHIVEDKNLLVLDYEGTTKEIALGDEEALK